MDNGSQVLDAIQTPVAGRRGGLRRAVTILALLSLLGAALVIARDAGTPTVSDKASIVAEVGSVADTGAPATLAQLPPVGGIICATLNAIAATLGPTGAALIQPLLVLFGCISP